MVPEVGGIELRVLVDLAREKSGAERAKRHEPDTKLLQGRQKLGLRTTPEQRILALHRGDRLDRVRTANRLNPGFRQAEVFDLALGNQFLDRSCHVLDRHVRIDAVLIEEIDVIGPQTLQASVGHPLDMLGPAIGSATALASLKIDVEAELCGNHHLVADRLERLAHQFFIRKRAIGFGRIEVRHATVVGGYEST